jgi:hypothetical protein
MYPDTRYLTMGTIAWMSDVEGAFRDIDSLKVESDPLTVRSSLLSRLSFPVSLADPRSSLCPSHIVSSLSRPRSRSLIHSKSKHPHPVVLIISVCASETGICVL